MSSYLTGLLRPFWSQPASIPADLRDTEDSDSTDTSTTPESHEEVPTDTDSEALKADDPSRAQAAVGSGTSSDSPFKVPELPNRIAGQASKPRVLPVLEVTDEDLDKPPQFPLPNSAQRSRAPAGLVPNRTPMPPPPVPTFDVRPPSPTHDDDAKEPSSLNIAVIPGTIPLGNMPPPPSTTTKPAFGMQQGATLNKPKREKVALGPGYSPLDWARLTQSGRNLRGVEGSMRVTLDELKKHNMRHDAWTALDGIVYNITPYLRFHPGGQKELLRGAGRDSTKLFMNTHSWVNYHIMLQECAIGPLVKG